VLTHGRKDVRGDPGEIEDLYAAITFYETGGVRFRLRKTGVNDGILMLRGRVSPHVSDSDPMTKGCPMGRILPMEENPEPEEAQITARALNAYLSWCHRILSEHPANVARRERGLPEANFLGTQRCGRRIIQAPFHELWGLRGMLVASGDVYAGLATELGMTFFRAQDGPDPDADIRERLKMALEDIDHDFIHVHTKAPDEAAHRGEPQGKRAAIEAIDRGLDELVQGLQRREDLIVAVTGDHSTPCISPLIHSGETVPILIAGGYARRDGVACFDEVSAARGCLGLLRGKELMLTLINYADRSTLLGHRLGKKEIPCFPKDYAPFTLKD
jgi:2,3-bisphosphoglycerate-independent phosphoglycerate mutase